MDTVTVIRGRRYKGEHRYTLTFSVLPNQTFGPWYFTETVRDLTLSAMLPTRTARDLVLEAFEHGSATAPTERFS
jgi:hypothetical protein